MSGKKSQNHSGQRTPSGAQEGEAAAMLDSYMTETTEYVKRKFNEAMDSYFTNVDPTFVNAVRDYPDRMGKKLRPSMVFLAAESFGLKKSDVADLALALEAVYNGYLVPDDIYDETTVRKGEPALHLKVGRARAMNASVELLNLAWSLINRFTSMCYENERPGIAYVASREYSRMTASISAGQDLEERYKGQNALKPESEPVYYQICRLKTVSYIATFPVIIGAIAAGHYDEVTLSRIKELFSHFGIAFQLASDLRDVIGKAASSGDFSALRERKLRLDVLHALDAVPDEVAARMHRIYSKPAADVGDADLAYIAAVAKDYGGVDYLRAKLAAETDATRRLWLSNNIFPKNRFSEMLGAVISSDMLKKYAVD